MDCSYCGAKASDEANYCDQCGKQLIEIDPTEVFHTVLECPYCPTMKKPRVVHTPRPWRVIVCDDCGGSYRTLEIIWSCNKDLELAVKHKSFLKI